MYFYTFFSSGKPTFFIIHNLVKNYVIICLVVVLSGWCMISIKSTIFSRFENSSILSNFSILIFGSFREVDGVCNVEGRFKAFCICIVGKSSNFHFVVFFFRKFMKSSLNSTNNNSTRPDDIDIRHLKHVRPLAIRYLTNMYSTALNTNTIPHL